MSIGLYGWWEPFAALMAILLPLLLAWWLVVRVVSRRPPRHKTGSGHNAQGRSDPS